MRERTVLILGANGRLGANAAQAFAAAGWQVLAQVRRPPADLPAGVRPVPVDVFDTRRIRAAAAGASLVVHALNPRYGQWQREAMPLAHAANAIAAAPDARLMLPGNVYAWGTTLPPLLTPQAPLAPDTPHGVIRARIERELERRATAGELRSTVVTAGDFYGPWPGTWIDLLICKRIAQHVLTYPGPDDLPHAWAYLPDLARTLVALAERPGAAAFERLSFPGHTLTGSVLLAALESAVRKLELIGTAPIRRRTMAWLPVRALGLCSPDMRALARMSYLWRVPHALDGTALAERVGAIPHTPLATALAATLAALAPTLGLRRVAGR